MLRLITSTLACLPFGLVSPALGEEWTGANNTDWDNAGNWVNGEIPGKGAFVTLPADATRYTIDLGANRTIDVLNIASDPLAGYTLNDARLTLGFGELMAGAGDQTHAFNTELRFDGVPARLIGAGTTVHLAGAVSIVEPGFALTKRGDGVLRLTGNTDLDGRRVVVEQGELQLDGPFALLNGTVELNGGGTTLTALDGTVSLERVDGSGSISIEGDAFLRLDSDDSYELECDLNGTGFFSKSGAGTLTLSRPGNLSGGVGQQLSVTEGTLQLLPSGGSPVGQALMFVDSAASVTGFGSLGPGPSIEEDAFLDPGLPIGVFTGGVMFLEGRLQIDLAGYEPGEDHDQLQLETLVMNPPSTTSILEVRVLDGFEPQIGDRFRIITLVQSPFAAFASVEFPDDRNWFVSFDSFEGVEGVIVGLTCDADASPDGDVNFGDILVVLASWGDCPGCPGDVNNDGTGDFSDILEVLAAWGPCP